MALALLKVEAKLTPSSDAWATPLIDVGILTSVTSSTVGTRSMAWMNCWRMAFFALMPLGQWTMHRSEVPPRATSRFQRRNGVLVAAPSPTSSADRCSVRPNIGVLEVEGQWLRGVVEEQVLVEGTIRAAFGSWRRCRTTAMISVLSSVPNSSRKVSSSPM